MYEREGVIYRIWRIVWPALRFIIGKRRGHFGMAPPEIGVSAETYRWWRFYLYSNIRRVLSSGRGGITTFTFGFLSVALPLSGLLIAGGAWLGIPAWITYAGLLLTIPYALALFTSYMGYVALRALPPDEYASTVLAGLTPSETLKTLAYEMKLACEWFERISQEIADVIETAIIRNILGNDMSIRMIDQDLAASEVRNQEALATFRAKLVTHRSELWRLSAMKEEASEILDIPRRRLCDHVFEYSPRLHEYLCTKYADNFESMLRGFSTRETGRARRESLRKQALQNQRIRSEAQISKKRLVALFEADAQLHSQIQRLASQHSSSGSLLAYARTLASQARDGLTSLTDFDGNPRDPRYRDVIDVIRFLHRKQQAYPGFDLHEACRRLAKRMAEGDVTPGAPEPNPGAEEGEVIEDAEATNPSERTDEGAERERSLARRQAEVLDHLGDPENRDFLAPTRSTYAERIRLAHDALGVLSHLGGTVEDYGMTANEAIVENYEAYVAEEGIDPDLIVTHGYSRTVRQVLKRVSKPVFFMKSHADSEDDIRDFDIHRMRHELTEDPDSTALHIWSGDEQVLPTLYEGAEIIVLLGAEAFDSYGRVLHPRGVYERVQRLTEELRCRVIVVAAHYKFQDEALEEYASGHPTPRAS